MASGAQQPDGTPPMLAPRRFWMPDLAAAHCTLCGQAFTVFRRRHHCRLCGKIFCHACSSQTTDGRALGLEGLVRVCDDCKRLEAQVMASGRGFGAEGGTPGLDDGSRGAGSAVSSLGGGAGGSSAALQLPSPSYATAAALQGIAGAVGASGGFFSSLASGFAGASGSGAGAIAGSGAGGVGSAGAGGQQLAQRPAVPQIDTRSHAAAHAAKGRAYQASVEFVGGGGALGPFDDRSRLEAPHGHWFNMPATRAGQENLMRLAHVLDAHLGLMVRRAVQLYIDCGDCGVLAAEQAPVEAGGQGQQQPVPGHVHSKDHHHHSQDHHHAGPLLLGQSLSPAQEAWAGLILALARRIVAVVDPHVRFGDRQDVSAYVHVKTLPHRADGDGVGEQRGQNGDGSSAGADASGQVLASEDAEDEPRAPGDVPIAGPTARRIRGVGLTGPYKGAAGPAIDAAGGAGRTRTAAGLPSKGTFGGILVSPPQASADDAASSNSEAGVGGTCGDDDDPVPTAADGASSSQPTAASTRPGVASPSHTVGPGSCELVDGCVFRKAPLHKRMRTSITKPRVLVINDSLHFEGRPEGASGSGGAGGGPGGLATGGSGAGTAGSSAAGAAGKGTSGAVGSGSASGTASTSSGGFFGSGSRATANTASGAAGDTSNSTGSSGGAGAGAGATGAGQTSGTSAASASAAASHHRLSSLSTLIEQDPSYSSLLVSKLLALRPDVIVIGHGAGARVTEGLLRAGVTVLPHCKPSVMQRVARVTGARLLPSVTLVDKLPEQEVVGTLADCFQVVHAWMPREVAVQRGLALPVPASAVAQQSSQQQDAFTEQQQPQQQQALVKATYCVFSGCPERLGCTVVLRGAQKDLGPATAILQHAIRAARHLRSVAAFLADSHLGYSPAVLQAIESRGGLAREGMALGIGLRTGTGTGVTERADSAAMLAHKLALTSAVPKPIPAPAGPHLALSLSLLALLQLQAGAVHPALSAAVGGITAAGGRQDTAHGHGHGHDHVQRHTPASQISPLLRWLLYRVSFGLEWAPGLDLLRVLPQPQLLELVRACAADLLQNDNAAGVAVIASDSPDQTRPTAAYSGSQWLGALATALGLRERDLALLLGRVIGRWPRGQAGLIQSHDQAQGQAAQDGTGSTSDALVPVSGPAPHQARAKGKTATATRYQPTPGLQALLDPLLLGHHSGTFLVTACSILPKLQSQCSPPVVRQLSMYGPGDRPLGEFLESYCLEPPSLVAVAAAGMGSGSGGAGSGGSSIGGPGANGAAGIAAGGAASGAASQRSECRNCRHGPYDHLLSFSHGTGRLDVTLHRLTYTLRADGPTAGGAGGAVTGSGGSGTGNATPQANNQQVQPQPSPSSSSHSDIVTWSYCGLCRRHVSPITRLSRGAWSLSFTGFLQMVFYSQGETLIAAADGPGAGLGMGFGPGGAGGGPRSTQAGSSAAGQGHGPSCPHPPMTAHVRYFGRGRQAACFKYTHLSPLVVRPHAPLPSDGQWSRSVCERQCALLIRAARASGGYLTSGLGDALALVHACTDAIRMAVASAEAAGSGGAGAGTGGASVVAAGSGQSSVDGPAATGDAAPTSTAITATPVASVSSSSANTSASSSASSSAGPHRRSHSASFSGPGPDDVPVEGQAQRQQSQQQAQFGPAAQYSPAYLSAQRSLLGQASSLLPLLTRLGNDAETLGRFAGDVSTSAVSAARDIARAGSYSALADVLSLGAHRRAWALKTRGLSDKSFGLCGAILSTAAQVLDVLASLEALQQQYQQQVQQQLADALNGRRPSGGHSAAGGSGQAGSGTSSGAGSGSAVGPSRPQGRRNSLIASLRMSADAAASTAGALLSPAPSTPVSSGHASAFLQPLSGGYGHSQGQSAGSGLRRSGEAAGTAAVPTPGPSLDAVATASAADGAGAAGSTAAADGTAHAGAAGASSAPTAGAASAATTAADPQAPVAPPAHPPVDLRVIRRLMAVLQAFQPTALLSPRSGRAGAGGAAGGPGGQSSSSSSGQGGSGAGMSFVLPYHDALAVLACASGHLSLPQGTHGTIIPVDAGLAASCISYNLTSELYWRKLSECMKLAARRLKLTSPQASSGAAGGGSTGFAGSGLVVQPHGLAQSAGPGAVPSGQIPTGSPLSVPVAVPVHGGVGSGLPALTAGPAGSVPARPPVPPAAGATPASAVPAAGSAETAAAVMAGAGMSEHAAPVPAGPDGPTDTLLQVGKTRASRSRRASTDLGHLPGRRGSDLRVRCRGRTMTEGSTSSINVGSSSAVHGSGTIGRPPASSLADATGLALEDDASGVAGVSAEVGSELLDTTGLAADGSTDNVGLGLGLDAADNDVEEDQEDDDIARSVMSLSSSEDCDDDDDRSDGDDSDNDSNGDGRRPSDVEQVAQGRSPVLSGSSGATGTTASAATSVMGRLLSAFTGVTGAAASAPAAVSAPAPPSPVMTTTAAAVPTASVPAVPTTTATATDALGQQPLESPTATAGHEDSLVHALALPAPESSASATALLFFPTAPGLLNADGSSRIDEAPESNPFGPSARVPMRRTSSASTGASVAGASGTGLGLGLGLGLGRIPKVSSTGALSSLSARSGGSGKTPSARVAGRSTGRSGNGGNLSGRLQPLGRMGSGTGVRHAGAGAAAPSADVSKTPGANGQASGPAGPGSWHGAGAGAGTMDLSRMSSGSDGYGYDGSSGASAAGSVIATGSIGGGASVHQSLSGGLAGTLTGSAASGGGTAGGRLHRPGSAAGSAGAASGPETPRLLDADTPGGSTAVVRPLYGSSSSGYGAPGTRQAGAAPGLVPSSATRSDGQASQDHGRQQASQGEQPQQHQQLQSQQAPAVYTRPDPAVWSSPSFGLSQRLSPSDMLLCDVKSDIVHSFADGSPGARVSFTVTTYWSVQFHGLRELCTDSQRSFIQSLVFSERWDASGGKSGARFEKSSDGRYIAKHVSRTELDMFTQDIAPAYFSHMHGTLVKGQPSILVRILGAFKVVVSPVDDISSVTPSLGAFRGLDGAAGVAATVTASSMAGRGPSSSFAADAGAAGQAGVAGAASGAGAGASAAPSGNNIAATATLSRAPAYVLVMENLFYRPSDGGSGAATSSSGSGSGTGHAGRTSGATGAHGVNTAGPAGMIPAHFLKRPGQAAGGGTADGGSGTTGAGPVASEPGLHGPSVPALGLPPQGQPKSIPPGLLFDLKGKVRAADKDKGKAEDKDKEKRGEKDGAKGDVSAAAGQAAKPTPAAQSAKPSPVARPSPSPSPVPTAVSAGATAGTPGSAAVAAPVTNSGPVSADGPANAAAGPVLDTRSDSVAGVAGTAGIDGNDQGLRGVSNSISGADGMPAGPDDGALAPDSEEQHNPFGPSPGPRGGGGTPMDSGTPVPVGSDAPASGSAPGTGSTAGPTAAAAAKGTVQQPVPVPTAKQPLQLQQAPPPRHDPGPPPVASKQHSDTVLLDADLLAHTKGQPLPLTDEGKRWLDAALRRDTAFLSGLTIVDYSILIGVARGGPSAPGAGAGVGAHGGISPSSQHGSAASDAGTANSGTAAAGSSAGPAAAAGVGIGGAPLAVAGSGPEATYGEDVLHIGLIDYIRRFDLVKRLESRVKTVVQSVGAGAEPTVVQPERYARRLLTAANRYFAFTPTVFSQLLIVGRGSGLYGSSGSSRSGSPGELFAEPGWSVTTLGGRGVGAGTWAGGWEDGQGDQGGLGLDGPGDDGYGPGYGPDATHVDASTIAWAGWGGPSLDQGHVGYGLWGSGAGSGSASGGAGGAGSGASGAASVGGAGAVSSAAGAAGGLSGFSSRSGPQPRRVHYAPPAQAPSSCPPLAGLHRDGYYAMLPPAWAMGLPEAR